jgi:hypothetical protein
VVEVCWSEHGRDRSGAITNKDPSSWIKMALRLDVFYLISCCVAVCALRACVYVVTLVLTFSRLLASLIISRAHFEPSVFSLTSKVALANARALSLFSRK